MDHQRAPVAVAIRTDQPAALRFAFEAARRYGAGLRVIHSTGTAHRREHPEGTDVLRTARRIIDQELTDVAVEYVLSSAPADRTLGDEAALARMMVVGADDVDWRRRWLGGAVATRLALHARCPVVVVPEVTRSVPPGGGVVVAVEGDTLAQGPLRFAFEQAASAGWVLHILHAMPAEHDRDEIRKARRNIAEVLAGWRSEFPDVSTSMQFPRALPDEACRHASESAELVVVGRPHGHTGPLRPLATQVLMDASGPVAVVPAAYAGERVRSRAAGPIV